VEKWPRKVPKMLSLPFKKKKWLEYHREGMERNKCLIIRTFCREEIIAQARSI
jgi:hypothetical protein